MSTKRRLYTEVSKRESVERAASSGLSVNVVATEFGLHGDVLQRWATSGEAAIA